MTMKFFRCFLLLLSAFGLLHCRSQAQTLRPEFDGNDKDRKKIEVRLLEVAAGTSQPTDIQFLPTDSKIMLLLEKEGRLVWYDMRGKNLRKPDGVVAKIPVLTVSEEGLLGLAFHPDFQKNKKIYLNYVTSSEGRDISRISEWTMKIVQTPFSLSIQDEKILLEVIQPFPNHNGGQLAFGPDGYLYIGLGDGGSAGDPHKAGQNTKNLLGKMLRIDVNRADNEKPYGIPKDNPGMKNKNILPEVWAWGLRNPWRYSFDSKGRLVVADVGQNKWEEVSIVEKGKNYGWNRQEGFECYPSSDKDCNNGRGLANPILTYGRKDGISITGGYVYRGKAVAVLSDKYIFGDYGSGRIWAVSLPVSANSVVKNFETLGRWPLAISTFGRDAEGEIYVGDFNGGKIYKITSFEIKKIQ